MSGNTGESASGRQYRQETGPEGSGRVSLLDQALWKQFNEAESPEAFVRGWLALQCRQINGAARGVVVLSEGEQESFSPAAYWPEEGTVGQSLATVIESALTERRGVVQDEHGATEADGSTCGLAYPFIVDGRLVGAVAIEIAGRSTRQLRGVMRQLQWGASWIEVLLRRQRRQDEVDRLDRTTTTLDLVGAVLDEDRFRAACNTLVTELATRLNCDQVSIGFLKRGRTAVTALSHAAQFGRRMNLIRDIGAAMDEAVDQECIILHPSKRKATTTSRAPMRNSPAPMTRDLS